MEDIVAFYLDSGLQYAETIPEITELRAPVVFRDCDGGWFSSRCIGVNNNFFPSLP